MSKKKTHAEYEEELLYKEIDCIPIETYNGAHTKIKHQCFCGEIWSVSPNAVLKGRKCPKCSTVRVKTTEEYIAELNHHNIEYKPLEPYRTAKMKILHQCSKGHVWMTRPKDILDGIGCKACNNKGRYNYKFFQRNPDKGEAIGTLYAVELKDNSNGIACIKVGITSTTKVNKRLKNYNKFNKIVIKTINLPLKECYNLEQLLLNKFDRYSSPIKFGGYKELLDLSCKQKLIELLERYGG